MKENLNINIDKNIIYTLNEYAMELKENKDSIIEKAIELYFDKLDEVIADKRIDNIKNNKEETIPLEEVFKKANINVWSEVWEKCSKRIFKIR